ncbi:MAG: CxxC-x17-CxxC domain-containing protein [Candidatus Falkowbacteria bacterium]
MKTFKKDSKPRGGRGGKDFGKGRDSGKKSFGGGARKFPKKSEERVMFNAVCSACGINCGVPFKPSEKRPVLCKGCFKKQGGSEGLAGAVEKSGFQSKSSYIAPIAVGRQDTALLESLNDKMDEILELLRPAIVWEDEPQQEELEEVVAKPAKAKRTAARPKAESKKK